MTSGPRTLLACAACGCTDVEVDAWVHANTGEVIDDEGPHGEEWCPRCGANDLGLAEVTEPDPYEGPARGCCGEHETGSGQHGDECDG